MIGTQRKKTVTKNVLDGQQKLFAKIEVGRMFKAKILFEQIILNLIGTQTNYGKQLYKIIHNML